MIAFLVDQNFNEHIVDGLTRRHATLEFTHVRDIGLAAAPDPQLLEWAATHGLILRTHDRKTIPRFAHARVAACLPMPGVFVSSGSMPIGQAIDQRVRSPQFFRRESLVKRMKRNDPLGRWQGTHGRTAALGARSG